MSDIDIAISTEDFNKMRDVLKDQEFLSTQSARNIMTFIDIDKFLCHILEELKKVYNSDDSEIKISEIVCRGIMWSLDSLCKTIRESLDKTEEALRNYQDSYESREIYYNKKGQIVVTYTHKDIKAR